MDTKNISSAVPIFFLSLSTLSCQITAVQFIFIFISIRLGWSNFLNI
jgi:hypothetical protein